MSLQMNYGFICTCPSCEFSKKIQPLAPLPKGTELANLERKLSDFALQSSDGGGIHVKSFDVMAISKDFFPFLNPSYLPNLSETFSKASHEGHYDTAVSAGHTLLALYLVLYPPNYPQTGEFHCC